MHTSESPIVFRGIRLRHLQGPSISNPIVSARPLSILGVLAQQLPSTLNYSNDKFDTISYYYIHTLHARANVCVCITAIPVGLALPSGANNFLYYNDI